MSGDGEGQNGSCARYCARSTGKQGRPEKAGAAAFGSAGRLMIGLGRAHRKAKALLPIYSLTSPDLDCATLL